MPYFIRIRILTLFIAFSPLMLLAVKPGEPVYIAIDKGEVLKLDGQWCFFWQQFVNPNPDSLSKLDLSSACRVTIPSYWFNYQHDSAKFSRQGFGSYYQVLKLPEGYREPLGIFIPSVDVAYRFYINGELIQATGKPAMSESDEEPDYKPVVIKYYPVSDTLQLVFHVSNYHHWTGGLWKDISIGEYDRLYKSYYAGFLTDIFTLGILISFGLFFLLFSFYHRTERSIAFFAICFLLVFLRGMCNNYYHIRIFLPISWDWMVKLEYIANFGGVAAGAWGFFYLYPIQRFKKYLLSISYLIVPILLVILFFNPSVFGFTNYLFYLLLFLFVSLLVVQSYFLAKMKHPTSKMYLTGVALLFLAILNDICVANSIEVLFQFYILPKVILLYVIILSMELFRRFVEIYKHERILGVELAALNDNLQAKVDERTSELTAQTEIIASQNDLLQKDIQLKNRILSIIGHDIRSPLSFVVMGLGLISDESISNENRKLFMQRILFSVSNLVLLVDNLLSWGLSQNKQLKVFLEEGDLSLLIERAIDNYLPIAEDKGVKINCDIKSGVKAWFDESTLRIVIRNLVSNAVKFTATGGCININLADKENFVEVMVTDNGVGISPDIQELVKSGSDIVSKQGTNNEKGTGLGLILSRELVELNGGELRIDSVPGTGSTFTFMLSKAKPE